MNNTGIFTAMPVLGLLFLGAYLAVGNPVKLPAGIRIVTMAVGVLLMALCVVILRGLSI